MAKPRGRKSKEVSDDIPSKMVTLRLSGPNFNMLRKAAISQGRSLNAFITELIERHCSGVVAKAIGLLSKDDGWDEGMDILLDVAGMPHRPQDERIVSVHKVAGGSND